MCTDLAKGIFMISDDLVFYPGYSFDTFKNSKYYSGQGEIEEIYLDDVFIIENRQFKVQLCFYDRKIYVMRPCKCYNGIALIIPNE